MLGWHGTVMMRVSRRKVLVRDDDTVLGTHSVHAGCRPLRPGREPGIRDDAPRLPRLAVFPRMPVQRVSGGVGSAGEQASER
jgi:hypothetical protein